MKKTNTLQLADSPTLRFSPMAWAKLSYFCHYGDNEIGGFGITSAEHPLFVEEFITVKQEVGVASVEFDDEAVADYFEDQVDHGRRPEHFARVWLHTHPGNSPTPSFTDEETFDRVFGKCNWALMFIVARQGKTYARLRFNVGPGGSLLIPVSVDYSKPFLWSDHEAWKAEFHQNIHVMEMCQLVHRLGKSPLDDEWPEECQGLDGLDPEELEWFAAQELDSELFEEQE